jgi:hypothetical protein
MFVRVLALKNSLTPPQTLKRPKINVYSDFGLRSDYIAIHAQVPAVLTVECLKDSSLIELTTEGTKRLLALFPEYEPYQRGNLELYTMSVNTCILCL